MQANYRTPALEEKILDVLELVMEFLRFVAAFLRAALWSHEGEPTEAEIDTMIARSQAA